MYLYTGGEPTMRRKDLMRICRENPDCAFLSFTNGTLIDDSFADEIREVGNFYRPSLLRATRRRMTSVAVQALSKSARLP